jgi:hypothetical protein
MAKLRKGILGPLTGKIGPVVTATWKNTVYVRAMPKKNNGPASPSQIASRQKFKFVHEVLKPFHTYLKAGFHHLATDKTEINLAFSINYLTCVSGVYPDLEADYSQLVLSEGRLLPLKTPVLELEPANLIRLSWSADWKPYSKFDDQLMLIVYCAALNLSDGFIGGIKRANQQCVFQIGPRMIGYEVDVYVGLLSLNGKQASNSQYLGRVKPL